jgi:SAM-dependent methyltransferase
MEDSVYEQLFELEDSHWWFRGRRQVIWALLRREPPPTHPRILDAGCGTGRNLLEYGPLGAATGIDPSPAAIAFCHRRGIANVIEAQLEQLPFADEQFDLLLACDVIEHIEDDLGALAELHRVASPRARLLLTVPAYQWLWSQHDETHHHKRRYRLRQLRERLRQSGFEPRVASYFNSTLLAPIALTRVAARRRTRRGGRSDYELAPRAVNRVLELPMVAEARLIERGWGFPAGVSIGMICERR